MKMCKHQTLIDRIRSGVISRDSLAIYEINAKAALKRGDQEAALVLEALKQAKPKDLYYVFMGFCPDGQIANRLDAEWRRDSLCYMHNWNAPRQPHQAKLFYEIKVNDLVILKVAYRHNQMMRLYGYGRVMGIKEVRHPDRENRFLEMNWSNQVKLIDVPLMGCNDTVNVRDEEHVHREAPSEFYKWLYEQETST